MGMPIDEDWLRRHGVSEDQLKRARIVRTDQAADAPPPPRGRSHGQARGIPGASGDYDPEWMPEGTVIARLSIEGRAVPWKAPNVGNGGARSPASLRRWKARVSAAATVAMKGRPPYLGCVRIIMRFCFAPSANGSIPDLTNCLKSTEDGLQGSILANDKKVVGASVERWHSWRDVVTIVVRACDRLIEVKPE